MSRLSPANRAWAMLQHFEREMLDQNWEAAAVYVNAAENYLALDASHDGLAAWFTFKADTVAPLDPLTLEFEAMWVVADDLNSPVAAEVTWSWGHATDLGPGTTPQVTSTGLTASHAFPQAGRYYVTMEIDVVDPDFPKVTFTRPVSVPFQLSA